MHAAMKPFVMGRRQPRCALISGGIILLGHFGPRWITNSDLVHVGATGDAPPVCRLKRPEIGWRAVRLEADLQARGETPQSGSCLQEVGRKAKRTMLTCGEGVGG
jgi:hypothetical protein